MATDTFAGPVDFLVFVFDEHADLGAGLHLLLDRVRQGVVEILDIELVTRDSAGAPVTRPFADLPDTAASDLAVFDGVESGILHDAEIVEIAAELHDGEIAVAVVYEDRSFAAAAAAWTEAGGRELYSGGIDIADLESALQEGNPS